MDAYHATALINLTHTLCRISYVHYRRVDDGLSVGTHIINKHIQTYIEITK